MNSNKRRHRSRFEIIRDILNSLNMTPLMRTKIMYTSNLSWARLIRYLPFLKDKALIAIKPGYYGNPVYYLTPKGKEVLKSLDNIIKILNERTLVSTGE